MSSETLDPRRWIALILLCATQFMLIIDVSIVNVALPTIERDLHFTDSSLQWVASAYALTFGGFLLLGGRMADLLGPPQALHDRPGGLRGRLARLRLRDRRATLLIAARAVQGLGGAMIAPAALSILTTTFAEGEERNKALARLGRRLRRRRRGGRAARRRAHASTSAGSGSSSSTCRSASSRSCWLPRLLRESRVEDAVRSFDVDRRGARHGEPLAARLHRRQDRRVPLVLGPHARLLRRLGGADGRVPDQRAARRHPLLPLSIFRLPTIVGANVVGFMLGAAIFSMFFLLALYMQSAAGPRTTPPIRSGIGYLLVACTIIVSAGASQALVGRLGVRTVLLAGLVLLTLGLLFFSRVSPHGTYLGDLAPGFILAGIGLGFAFIPVTIAALMGISERRGGARLGPHQHVAADRRRRRRGAARDRLHEPHARADAGAASPDARLHRRSLARVPGRGADDAPRAGRGGAVLIRAGRGARSTRSRSTAPVV